MFKIIVHADSMEELKLNLEPIFNLIDKSKVVTQPTPEDLGYGDEGIPVAPSLAAEIIGEEADAVMTAPTPFPIPTAPQQVSVAATLPSDRELPGPTVDSRGIPWDSRIHSANQSVNKDGTWKKRRNVDEALVKEIEKGLTAPVVPAFVPPMPSPAPVVEQPVAAAPALPNLGFPAPPAFTPPSPAPVAPVIPALPPVVPQQAPVVPAVPSAPDAFVREAHTLETFRAKFVMIVNNLIAAHQIKNPREWLAQITAHYGAANWWQIVENQLHAEQLFQAFGEWEYITNVG